MAGSQPAPSEILDSWKEISQYLDRDIRTLQRWELQKALPVHRVPGGEKPRVYAVKSELDQWRSSRQIHLAGTDGDAVPAERTTSVAILPFLNLAGGKEDEYFGDGLADEIITALSRVDGLRVTARTSSFAFRDKDQDIREIGRRLNAGAVLEGSIRRSGNRIRVTAQLVNAADGYHIWSERYDRELTDVFALQDEMSRAIVDALRVNLAGELPAVKRETSDSRAYHLWLKGRHHCLRQTLTEALRSRDYFEQAVAIDPGYARAHLGIAEAWWECALFGMVDAREAVEKGRAAATRALKLDPALGEAHSMLGVYLGVHDFEWERAEAEFRRAIDLSPASPMVYARYSAFLLEPKLRLEEAQTALEIALELDPLSPVIHSYLGQCMMFRRDYVSAAEHLRNSMEMDPDYWMAPILLGGSYAFQGQFDRSIQIGEQALERFGRMPMIVAAQGAARALLGDPQAARDALAELQSRTGYVQPLAIAWAYMGLFDLERCLDWLERAVEARDPQIIHFAVKPMYDPFRMHPRFQSLMRTMRLA